MRVLIGKAEAGGAGVVHNVAKELRSLGHTVKPMLFEDLIPKLPPDRVWFIANGVGQEFFHRRAWSETREPKLLFVGTWIDHKGLYALAETLEQLLVLAPRVQLTLAGCAETDERVRRYFSPTAQRSINVRPFISGAEMPEVYAKHDIFVLPSLVEGMPSVFLLEAMASGLAVVTTKSTGMTDLVEDGHDG